MWIKTKKNIFLVFLTLFLSSFSLVACGSSTNVEKQETGNNQQDIDTLFKKAESLFDEDKPQEAYSILKKLAEQGDAKAQNSLGNGYEYGYWGEINLKQAEYWYRKAADQNYVKGIHNLGVSIFLQKRYKDALSYFEKAASMNHADSINMLGIYHQEGIVFEQDYKKALEYFSKAIDIDADNASALFNIGQAYYYGEGVGQDYNEAFAWYVKSANQDYSLAKIQLAEMYFSGQAVPKNVKKAIEIIKPLAELGDPKAQQNLKWYVDHPN
ncbi:tetratricopeptide repeat protein [Acinetobacter indicus]|uniref:tetratricopeptide repeat protein n=1 Tax=Acinetobacter indicus TaxID=756892 RepID=UPI00144001F3|nr:tetratricopeptide repeat protein [Acinetobacter indicus]MDM1292561.1 sel1 repeat family protein [Acinetobacter indicus]MDM1322595.1 sel1 repeat family protein [Acinetobacter indicus]MDM1334312.1 sel1 repeat family protein [Acinetobacter indicus]QIZ58595.1 sel1 repeat family protein [Acinetobacter indicus]